MEKKEPKGILEKKAQQLSNPHKMKFSDQSALQKAAQDIEKLQGVKNINGVMFLNRGFLRGYYIDAVGGKNKPEKYIAFVFPMINKQVLDFLVNAAKTDAINGIVGSTENVYIVKQYKI